MKHSARHAFTLVELAIVLVIIGLVAGGIMVGRDMIRSSQLNGVIAEWQRYGAAMAAFKDQYRSIPGDMRNAVSYWGAVAGGTADGYDATCMAVTTAAVATETCNGDGNGRVGEANSVPSFKERPRFWQHLANAGLIEGHYAGVQLMNTPGIDVGASKLDNAGWTVSSFALGSSGLSGFDNDFNTLTLGAGVDDCNGTSGWGGVLTGIDALYVDQKGDDGSPYTGNIIGYHQDYAGCGCVGNTSDGYIVTSDERICTLHFKPGL